MKRRLSALLPVLVMALYACEATAPVRSTQDEGVRAARREQYFVGLRYLNEGVLKERYGAQFNPFIAYPRPLSPRRFIVFRLNVEEVKRPLLVRLGEMELTFGNYSVPPLDQQEITRYWHLEDETTGIGPHEQAARDKVLRQEVFPEDLRVPAGGRASGMLVFAANFPRYGEARLTVPLLDADGRVIERLEYTFAF